jgi:hypothetical protein
MYETICQMHTVHAGFYIIVVLHSIDQLQNVHQVEHAPNWAKMQNE